MCTYVFRRSYDSQLNDWAIYYLQVTTLPFSLATGLCMFTLPCYTQNKDYILYHTLACQSHVTKQGAMEWKPKSMNSSITVYYKDQ